AHGRGRADAARAEAAAVRATHAASLAAADDDDEAAGVAAAGERCRRRAELLREACGGLRAAGLVVDERPRVVLLRRFAHALDRVAERADLRREPARADGVVRAGVDVDVDLPGRR